MVELNTVCVAINHPKGVKLHRTPEVYRRIQ